MTTRPFRQALCPASLARLAVLLAITSPLPAATEAGITWERRRFEREHMHFNDAAVNSTGRIVAVAAGGAIQYSDTDGVSWTSIDPPTHLDLTSIHWDGTRFIAGSGVRFHSGMVMTSTDGLSWSKICLGSSDQVLCVCGNSTTSLAVGYNGTSLTSADTSSWSPSPSVTDNYYGATWTGTQFVRVGLDGLIETSPAGNTWTSRHSDPDDTLHAVAANGDGSVNVAVGWDGAASLPRILTSPDGVAWSPQNMTAHPGGSLRTITWTGSHFVACGSSDQILTSTDGSAWSSHSAGTNEVIYGLCWTGTSLIAVGWRGTVITAPLAAPGAGDWTVRLHGDREPTFNAFAQEGIGGTNRIVAVATKGTIFYTDDDGLSGSSPVIGTSDDLNDITSTGSGFITVGENGTILTSSDGIAWGSPASGVANDLNGVTWYHSLNLHATPHRAIVVGTAGTILTADNGIGWTSRSSGTISTLSSVASGLVIDPKPPHDASRLVVAVGLSGRILSSPSGINWTTETSGTVANIHRVIARPSGGFLAVGASGIVLRSGNGKSWSHVYTGGNEPLYDVCWTGSQYVAVGGDGVIHTSPAGTTWTRRYGRTVESLRAVIGSPTGRILAGGGQGVIISSDPAIDFGDWIAAQSPPAGQDDPENDPNGDGIDNLTAYGFGIPAVDPPTSDDLSRLLRWVDPSPGQPARIRLGPNYSDLGDVIYAVEWSPDLSPGSWTEIFRHYPGQECGTGGVHIFGEDTGFADIEIPEPIGFMANKFYRIRLELIP